jgi:hypothetical protein
MSESRTPNLDRVQRWALNRSETNGHQPHPNGCWVLDHDIRAAYALDIAETRRQALTEALEVTQNMTYSMAWQWFERELAKCGPATTTSQGETT